MGAKAAGGDYIAFLNNDTKVDSQWLTELLRPVYKDSETVCAGSKVLSYDGQKLDFAGGMINFEGKGFQVDFGLPKDEDIHDQYAYLPFVNGGAMLVDRKVFLSSGGFDEDFLHTTKMLISAGGCGCLGAEWFLHRNLLFTMCITEHQNYFLTIS